MGEATTDVGWDVAVGARGTVVAGAAVGVGDTVSGVEAATGLPVQPVSQIKLITMAAFFVIIFPALR